MGRLCSAISRSEIHQEQIQITIFIRGKIADHVFLPGESNTFPVAGDCSIIGLATDLGFLRSSTAVFDLDRMYKHVPPNDK